MLGCPYLEFIWPFQQLSGSLGVYKDLAFCTEATGHMWLFTVKWRDWRDQSLHRSGHIPWAQWLHVVFARWKYRTFPGFQKADRQAGIAMGMWTGFGGEQSPGWKDPQGGFGTLRKAGWLCLSFGFLCHQPVGERPALTFYNEPSSWYSRCIECS